jgi:hypothetical protein
LDMVFIKVFILTTLRLTLGARGRGIGAIDIEL